MATNKINLNIKTSKKDVSLEEDKISISQKELQEMIAKQVSLATSQQPAPQIIHVGDTNNARALERDIHKKAKEFQEKWSLKPNAQYGKDLQNKLLFFEKELNETQSFVKAKLAADKKYPNLISVVYGEKQEGPPEITINGAHSHVDYQFEKTKETYVYVEDYQEIIGKLNGATVRQPINIPPTFTTNSGAPVEVKYKTFQGDVFTALPKEMQQATSFENKEAANKILKEVLAPIKENK